jgi:hypothetical protein
MCNLCGPQQPWTEPCQVYYPHPPWAVLPQTAGRPVVGDNFPLGCAQPMPHYTPHISVLASLASLGQHLLGVVSVASASVVK